MGEGEVIGALEKIQKIKDISVPQKNEITFIVAGKILQNGKLNTISCLKSIRVFFPESKIILSTWNDEPVEECQPFCDQINTLNFSDFPIKYSSLLNQNRPNTGYIQQVLVHTALEKVTTKWTVKTRTDFVLENDNFFHFYCQWDLYLSCYHADYRIFQRRVLAPWLFTKNPDKTSVAYQLSDFFQFGLTDDLLLLWDGHQDLDEHLNFYTLNPENGYTNPEKYNHLYNVEQAFFMNAIEKSDVSVKFPKWYCDPISLEVLDQIHLVYSSNVLLATLCELGWKTRWEYEEPIFGKGMLISFQMLLSWYLEDLEPNNQRCKDFLLKNPEPCLRKIKISRKIRMLLREITFFRVVFRWVKVVCRRISIMLNKCSETTQKTK